ncbi:MAG: glycine--tRNA ligase subunit beta [Thermodesulfobacteriota bacterium]
MTGELILEIGTEEIPALFLRKAGEDLKASVQKEFSSNSLEFDDLQTYFTPRRLVVYVKGLNDSQKDKLTENFGPPKRIAFDEKGKPTKAAIGFAKSQNVDIKNVEVARRDNGEFLCVRNKVKGKKTRDVLKEILPKLITSIPFRKSMRWGDGTTTFARPIRWIAAVYNGTTIPFAIENVRSSNSTYGHRFTSKKAIRIKDFKQYLTNLDKNNVVLDSEKRKEIIVKDINKIAKKVKGKIHEDPELMETVINIVEHPTVLIGEFEKKFLKLPEEVLISVMKNHQKYFPLYSAGNKLLSYFIFVCGTPVKNSKVVIRGNERVIRARFNDAEFFYAEDSRRKLSGFLDELKSMVYLSQIGNYYEKVKRLEKNAKVLSTELNLKDEKDLVRAAGLAKADLATQMVFEFSELQGIMGNYYSAILGEKKEVSTAIEEHYMPLTRDGNLPETNLGSLLSIVDKVDNITSCFIAGLIPTGSADPYALRRQAIGIIKIVLERNLNISLGDLFSKSVKLTLDSLDKDRKKQIDSSPGDIVEKIIGFISERFKNVMIDEGYSGNIIDSVISTGFDNIIYCNNKIKALQKFHSEKEFEELSIAFKRVCNIAKDKPEKPLSTKLFSDRSETALYNEFNKIKKSTSKYFEQNSEITSEGDYIKALSSIKKLKKPIDNFFDSVMVMDKDEKIKNNRLALLNEIKELFFQISDFSKI